MSISLQKAVIIKQKYLLGLLFECVLAKSLFSFSRAVNFIFSILYLLLLYSSTSVQEKQ